MRDGLIAANVSDMDRRSRTVSLTKKGYKVLEDAYSLWKIAHASFQKKSSASASDTTLV